jgi:hypothetical protein
MITIRRLNKNTVVVLKDISKQIELFTGKDAEAKAKAYAIKRNHGNLGIDWDKVLFVTEGGPVVCHITDAGDNTEPPKLCKYSILRIADSRGEVTLLACELTDLVRQWLKIARRLKKT